MDENRQSGTEKGTDEIRKEALSSITNVEKTAPTSFQKGNSLGRRFSSEYQPSREARSRGNKTRYTKRKAIEQLCEIEARKQGIIVDLLFSKETSRTIIDSVTERLGISPREVTAYHGMILRQIVEAQNGNSNSAAIIRQELNSIRDYLQEREDKENEGKEKQIVIHFDGQ